jgi:hypothetical protein
MKSIFDGDAVPARGNRALDETERISPANPHHNFEPDLTAFAFCESLPKNQTEEKNWNYAKANSPAH